MVKLGSQGTTEGTKRSLNVWPRAHAPSFALLWAYLIKRNSKKSHACKCVDHTRSRRAKLLASHAQKWDQIQCRLICYYICSGVNKLLSQFGLRGRILVCRPMHRGEGAGCFWPLSTYAWGQEQACLLKARSAVGFERARRSRGTVKSPQETHATRVHFDPLCTGHQVIPCSDLYYS
jgi:hypothetical protein